MRSRQGFSLVELLVVIGIVGILAAIAFPAYHKHVRSTACDSGKAGLIEANTIMNQFYVKLGTYQNKDVIQGGAGSSGTFEKLPTIPQGSTKPDFDVTIEDLTVTGYKLVVTPNALGRLKDTTGYMSIDNTGKKEGTGSYKDVWTNGCSGI